MSPLFRIYALQYNYHLSTKDELIFGFGLYAQNKPESFKQQEEEERFFWYPPMFFIGFKF